MQGPAFFIVFLVVWVVILAVKKSVTSSAQSSYAGVASKGLPARGILLEVAARGDVIGTAPRRYARRLVTIDVEIPGEAPYVMSTTATIPLNLVRDVLPGATVELRVDKKRRDMIAIVGPGAGFAMFALGAGDTQNQAAS